MPGTAQSNLALSPQTVSPPPKPLPLRIDPCTRKETGASDAGAKSCAIGQQASIAKSASLTLRNTAALRNAPFVAELRLDAMPSSAQSTRLLTRSQRTSWKQQRLCAGPAQYDGLKVEGLLGEPNQAT
ncbi:hypothetical protein HJFPF1_06712 [Paramyrothecium foliicola]|nr:hypothetical protein HJFPF1_06712 [Paramyrothecium foliicola]